MLHVDFYIYVQVVGNKITSTLFFFHTNKHFFMARLISPFFFIFFLLTTTTLASKKPSTVQIPNPKQPKISHLQFYWHDIYSGKNPTAAPIAQASTTNASSTGFGLVSMIDDPLTSGPTMESKLLGRAQGFYGSASQQTVGLMMVMNFHFVEGKYNGSTITVIGRNEVLTSVREMAVVGGSGLFRFATGYVQARTHTFDVKTGDAVVHYDCFVMHY